MSISMPAALKEEIGRLENLFWVDKDTLKRISQRFREELEEGESHFEYLAEPARSS